VGLEAWHEAGFITTHATSRQEISDLLAIVDIDLKDAEIPELSAERKLSCCYNAILTAARAALQATGYRVPKSNSSHHYAQIEERQMSAAQVIRQIVISTYQEIPDSFYKIIIDMT
jgi:hypothetical protein